MEPQEPTPLINWRLSGTQTTKFLNLFSDAPPTKGYTAIIYDSLLEYKHLKNLKQDWLETEPILLWRQYYPCQVIPAKPT